MLARKKIGKISILFLQKEELEILETRAEGKVKRMLLTNKETL